MLTREKFKIEFAGLCEVFDREATKSLAHAYYEVLKDMSDDDFSQAISVVLKTRKYTKLPLPNDIREGLTGNVATAAIVALDKAEKAIEKYSAYRSVQFDDPVIHMAIESMGGWIKFCRPEDEQDWHWHQKEFLRLYEAFATRPRSCQNILPGLLAMDPNRQMMGLPEPVGCIGDEKKRLAWTSKNSQPEQITGQTEIKQIDIKKL